MNLDKGVHAPIKNINHGALLSSFAVEFLNENAGLPLKISMVKNRDNAIKDIKNKRADALIIIPENFSLLLHQMKDSDSTVSGIIFIGDVTDTKYVIPAIWANEVLSDYISAVTGKSRILKITETAIGSSSSVDEFNYSVPGLLILSLIMLMFTAAIAIVTEVENKTMLRLKLSRVNSIEFLTGISIIQIGIGFISILLSLALAISLGFSYTGSLMVLLFIALLTSISIIAFSLIIAAITKTVNEVLIVGNFPMFMFMFFTGVAFPIGGKTLFTVAGYPFKLPGLMSPNHAVSALKKVLIMNMNLSDIIPEIFTLLILTLLYFLIGIWMFKKRHMRVE
jgi:ABC-2 type transport system permease protein